MATSKSTTTKSTAAKSTATVDIKEKEASNGKKTTVYKMAQAELDRLGNDDGAGRKVDKALEEARGKDTWRAHIQLVAVQEVDDRAEARFAESTKTRGNQFDAIQKKAEAHYTDLSSTSKTQFTAVQKKADDHNKTVVKTVEASRDAIIDTQNEQHSEAITLAEQQFADTNAAIEAAQSGIVREVATTRDEVLNGQAVIGEAINTAQKAAAKDADGIVKLVEKNLAALAQSQGEDGKTILETLQAQHEATLELIKSAHADLDAKISYFREEFARDMEKVDAIGGNQHASVRGDLNVVMALLSDIRKDQIGRPERR